jgi:asparagine synthase (glutamine-hydrolysing)
MANFLIVVDPDVERRSRFVDAVEPMIPPLEGLLAGKCSSGDFCAVWAAEPRAPIIQVADDQGAAVIWGEAITDPGPERQDAATLRKLWSDPALRASAFYDGFYAAAVYEPTSGLTVGADLLGLYPVYYYCADSVMLAGSSPELFQYHPSFRQEFNPAGLVGILLTGGLVEGQTLFRDVLRLSPGHLLLWHPDMCPEEIEQYSIPLSNRYYSFPLAAMVDPLDHAIEQAFSRQVPRGERYTLMLSGGMDSRMVAGYLSEMDHDFVALTFGLPTDLETKCAQRVASTLSLEHRVVEFPLERYPHYSDLTARWDHLATGFSFPWGWGLSSHLRELAPSTISGHLLDIPFGGASIGSAYSPSSMTMSFEPYFAYSYVLGFRPEILKKLLRHEVFQDLVDETMERIRQEYRSYGELESQRIMCFDLYHEGRFHIGGMAWKTSFGAWPTLPAVDRSVLEAAAGMPAAAFGQREVQTRLFCQRFPRLAQLPLEGVNRPKRAPQPRFRQQVAWHLEDRLAPYLHRLQDLTGFHSTERNRVHRIGDFNGSGWQAVRRHAEPYRERVSHLFRRDVLDELLPPPGENVHSWQDYLPLKLLVGLMLFSKENL